MIYQAIDTLQMSFYIGCLALDFFYAVASRINKGQFIIIVLIFF